ncbi:nSTAND1 domain-containing NTPase [Streptomyces sp. NPDC003691]
MGRPEAPLDPDGGPVQRFAYELRQLRTTAGGPTYRAMAARVPYSVPTLSRAAAGEQLPSLAVALAYAEACGGDRAEWERRWHEAADAAQAAAGTGPDDDGGADSPYQGLARFEPGDHERFFGRERLVAEVAELVGNRRFAAVFGPSGSGKSSLLRAGLVPALREERGRFAAIRVLTPGARPLRTHGELLAVRPRTTSPAPGQEPGPGAGPGVRPGSGVPEASSAAVGGREARGSGDARSRPRTGAVPSAPAAVPPETPPALRGPAATGGGTAPDTLVVVDQFEEVFTLCEDPAERAGFLELLLAARDPAAGLRVVIAVRADFYGRCAAHRGLAEALSAASLLVGPMSQAELRRAVVGPAQRAALIVEREVTRRIVAEVEGEPGGLPLLSHALRETWRRRRGRVLTTAAYEASGGAHGAIARTAEDIHAALSEPQRRLARAILLRLVTPGDGSPDTRRPVPRAELSFGDPARTAVVVERLAGARLLTLDDGTVDLAHEALLTAWPRLGRWIDEDRERLRTQRRLTEAARTWEELDREPAALYTGTRLATAEEHFAAPAARAVLTPAELDFLTASGAFRASRRRRRRALLAGGALVIALALVAGVVAWQQNRTGDRRHREAEARRIAEVAHGLRYADPRQAMRLGVAAWRLADTTETRAALLGAVTQREEDVFELPEELTGRTTAVGPAPAGPTPEVRSAPAGPGTPAAEPATSGPAPSGPSLSDGPALPGPAASGPAADPGGPSLTGPRPGAGPRDDTAPGYTPPVLSADGRTLVLVREDRIRSWDLRGPDRPRTRVHPGPGASPYDSFALSPDGRHLAVADGNGGVRVRDLHTGRSSGRIPAAEPTGLTVARGGRVLVVARTDGTAEVWDTGARRRTLVARTGGRYGVEAVAVSADGTRVAVCGTGRPLGIWDITARTALPAPARGPAECALGAFDLSPDGRTAAVATDRGIRRWDTGTGRELAELPGERPGALRFSHDGTFLLAATTGELLLWRPAYPAAPVFRHTLEGDDVHTFALDLPRRGPGALRYANGDETAVRTLRLDRVTDDDWSPRPALPQRLTADGRVLARPAGPGRGFTLLDTATGRTVGAPPGSPCAPPPGGTAGPDRPAQECRLHSAFSADGQRFAHWDAVRRRVAVWDVERRRPHAYTRPHAVGEAVGAFALSADGHRLYTPRTGADGRELIDVWDVRTAGAGRYSGALPGIGGDAITVLGDATGLISSGGAFADLRTGRAVRRILDGNGVATTALSPDGERLAVASPLGRVTLWDGRLRHRLLTLSGGGRDTSRSVTVQKDGRTGTVVQVTFARVTALAFTPDGRTLAAGGSEGVRLWDVASGRPLGSPLPTAGDPVLSVAFSADGRTLHTAGLHSGPARHDLDPGALAAAVCARTGGGLSRAEWKAQLRDVPYRNTCD